MRILLVYPDLKIHVNFPVGLGLVSSVLRSRGHETAVVHFNEEMGIPFDLGTLERRFRDFEPQLVAFSSVSNQFSYVRRMSAFIKSISDVPILVGGVHATICPEKILREGTIDIACRGEGEMAIVELADKMEKGEDVSGVLNMAFRANGTPKVNPIRPLIDAATLDSLPFPDREVFHFGEIIRKKRGWVNVMSGRGCLMNCTYCVNHFFRRVYSGTNSTKDMIRFRRVDTVLKEVEEIKDRYPHAQIVNFDDDIFTLDRGWMEEFCEKYPARIGLPFACNAHPRTLDRKTAGDLARAGCVEVKIGIESGSRRVRREVLKRPLDDDALFHAFRAAEEAGIRAWSFNMVGIPTETRDEVLDTARLNARIRPYIVRCTIFFPYEGTDLHRYAEEHGLIDEGMNEGISSNFEDTTLKMPQLAREEIVRFKTLFKWHIDANSDIEAAPFFRELVRLFEKLPAEYWATGKGQELYRNVDASVDRFLRELKMEHYATRSHLDLNFCARWNHELP